MTERRTPRKPATKFPNLRKKLAKNKVMARQAKKKVGEPFLNLPRILDHGNLVSHNRRRIS